MQNKGLDRPPFRKHHHPSHVVGALSKLLVPTLADLLVPALAVRAPDEDAQSGPHADLCFAMATPDPLVETLEVVRAHAEHEQSWRVDFWLQLFWGIAPA